MSLALLPLRRSLSRYPLLLKSCPDFTYRDSGDSEIFQLLSTLVQAWGLLRLVWAVFPE